MTEKLKRCPLCKGEPYQHTNGYTEHTCVGNVEIACSPVEWRAWCARIPRPTPPDEVGDVVAEMGDVRGAIRAGRVTDNSMCAMLTTWQDRLSRYTPGETEEVQIRMRLRGEVVKAAESIRVNGEHTSHVRLFAALDALEEWEGRNG
jgi:hypothetical protein